MAAQAALIHETIAGMKRAISRFQDSSDSDEPYLQPTNRGNKLKRKAHHIGLGVGRGLEVKEYHKSIQHAGYQRRILRRNPPRYDEDGELLDDDEVDEEADVRAAEENPYADIRLEELLLPLTAAASLPTHPSMSIAYTSSTLTNMAQHACETVQKERRTLASAKRMILKLRGDETWLPGGAMCSDRDEGIFNTRKVYETMTAKGWTHGVTQYAPKASTDSAGNSSTSASRKSSQSETESRFVHGGILSEGNGDQSMSGTEKEDATVLVTSPTTGHDKPIQHDPRPSNNNVREGDLTKAPSASTSPKAVPDAGVTSITESIASTLHESKAEDPAMQASESSGVKKEVVADNTKPLSTEQIHLANEISYNANAISSRLPSPNDEGANEEAIANGVEEQDHAQPPPRRMRTRAQAQAVNEPTIPSRSETPESWIPPEIHPLFKIPTTAKPDRDFGLLPKEAEETRRLLNAYVQKQEEICRGSEKLYEGLLRADWQRKAVLKWCKAEGHVGEMSDGEDWYDREEWGLEGDLEKGQNEDDGDNNVIQGKKTRGRRA